MQINSFVKSHGLGNDYIVLDSAYLNISLSTKAIVKICDIHYGIGSDGILLKVPSTKADFGVRIFNPDGSEAEKSGNGLRIFSKFLHDYSYALSKTFTIETLSGIVTAEILEEKFGKAQIVKVEMGKAEFIAKNIPVLSSQQECLGESLTIGDKTFIINCVSVGNPHCVVITDSINEEELRSYGPLLETNNKFPNKINVQFAKVISPSEVEVQIWERGAGYTLASGSSSCAVACVTHKLGLTNKDVKILMPGGNLAISIDENWNIRMTGMVREIASGILSNELIEDCK
jgi:diaminopimelate epimerase